MQLPDLEAIDHRYDHVVISPHLDDAAASCGGFIFDRRQAGDRVLVVTVFTAGDADEGRSSPKAYAKRLDYDRRRAEDRAAMTLLGVDYIWLGYPEILFREPSPLHRYRPRFRNTPLNRKLCRDVAEDLELVRRKTACNALLLPMAIGQHMDHQIVFQAGLHLLKSKENTCRLSFYEDYPYVFFPHMLYYRMKVTGWIRRLTPGQREGLLTPHPSALRDAAALLSGTPSLNMGFYRAGPLHLLAILIFGFYARHLLKTGPCTLNKGWRFSTQLIDISHTIDAKLDAIMAYRSQIAGPDMTRRRFLRTMQAYSTAMGLPHGRTGERFGNFTKERT